MRTLKLDQTPMFALVRFYQPLPLFCEGNLWMSPYFFHPLFLQSKNNEDGYEWSDVKTEKEGL